MKERLRYGIAAAVLLLAEVLIALYVRDAFLRPYGGDILVTVLLCCLGRAAVWETSAYLPLWVFLFAAAVECAQALGLASLIPASMTAVRIAVGGVFSWWDLLCYAAGCLLFSCAEGLISVLKTRKFKKDS